MSYEVYTSRQPNEPKWENDTHLMETRRPYWSRITLVGKGEHEGTNLTLTKEQVFIHKFEDERELAALFDRKFQIAHAHRLARESGLLPPEDEGEQK